MDTKIAIPRSAGAKSIKPRGGHLICVEEYLSQYWLGIKGNSSALGERDDMEADYWRACNVRDYVGLVEFHQKEALVFGDMPLETSIWHKTRELPNIVRVYYADADVDVVEKLNSMPAPDFSHPLEIINVSIKQGPMIVFDSATPGKEIGEEYLTIDLGPGEYRLSTKQFFPDDRTSVLIHKFDYKLSA